MNAAIYLEIFFLFFFLLIFQHVALFSCFLSVLSTPVRSSYSCLFVLVFLSTSFTSSIFLCPFHWFCVVMLKTVVYGNQVRFESLKNSAGTCTKLIYVAYIYILDTYRRNDNRRKNKERGKEDAGIKDAWRLLYKHIYLSLYCKGSKGLFKGLHVRGCLRPNINFIFWPHCYDCRVVSFLFSCCSTGGLGFTVSGVSESPLGRVWPSLPHLVSSCLEFYWQLLWHPELNSIM